jgi:benzoyl-CoA reductase subunit BamB
VETTALIQQELNDPRPVAAIGLAGENRVYYASIEQDRSSASRGASAPSWGTRA